MAFRFALLCQLFFLVACNQQPSKIQTASGDTVVVKPVIVTDTVRFDTDDPAIWLNPEDASKSLIVGTDKDADGALYVFDLNGKIVEDKVVKGLKRPNNVDIEYGLRIGNQATDIVVVTERMTHQLRIFSLPDMRPLDHGGLTMFEGEVGEGFRDLMGIALYKDAKTNNVYAIVGRKNGPVEGYLWQYLLEDDGHEGIRATLVRKFGKYSGTKEIESIAVDDELGFVYYSDEGVGIRKYYSNPDKGNEELAFFGTSGFTQDHEGISIFPLNNGKGYILVSDQQSNRFHIFSRQGTEGNPHLHQLLKTVYLSTQESDGSDVTAMPLNSTFQHGLFVAMSTNKTFQYYRWEDIAGSELQLNSARLNAQIK